MIWRVARSQDFIIFFGKVQACATNKKRLFIGEENYCPLLWRKPGKENSIHPKWRKISCLCQQPINININCSILFGIVTGHSIRHLYANSQSFRLLHAYQLSGPELGCQQDKWWSGSFGALIADNKIRNLISIYGVAEKNHQNFRQYVVPCGCSRLGFFWLNDYFRQIICHPCCK